MIIIYEEVPIVMHSISMYLPENWYFKVKFYHYWVNFSIALKLMVGSMCILMQQVQFTLE